MTLATSGDEEAMGLETEFGNFLRTSLFKKENPIIPMAFLVTEPRCSMAEESM